MQVVLSSKPEGRGISAVPLAVGATPVAASSNAARSPHDAGEGGGDSEERGHRRRRKRERRGRPEPPPRCEATATMPLPFGVMHV